jgi:hypothetical protein
LCFPGESAGGQSGEEERGKVKAAGTYGLYPPSSIEVNSRIDDAFPGVLFVGVVASSSG